MARYEKLINNLLKIMTNCSAGDPSKHNSFISYVRRNSSLQSAIFLATHCLAGGDTSPGKVHVHNIVLSYIMILVSMSDYLESEDFTLFDRLRNHGAVADIFKYAIECTMRSR
jgi:hypothetical protein